MTNFLQDYEPVEDRIRAFWSDHPEGRIVTKLVRAEAGEFIVLASIFRSLDPEDSPASTGYAQETVTQRGVNSTSALENCETSAIGRALANLGYAAKGKRPSREEMSKSAVVQREEKRRALVGAVQRPASAESSPAPLAGTKTDSEAGGAATAAPGHSSVAGDTSSEEGVEPEGEAGSGPSSDQPTPSSEATGDLHDTPTEHDAAWVDSPKLSRYQVCAFDGCLATRRKQVA